MAEGDARIMNIKTFSILKKYCKKEGLKMAVPIQTNEEWLCSLSATEKSEFLSTIAKKAESVSWWDNWLKEEYNG